jgi:hypothetical protein
MANLPFSDGRGSSSKKSKAGSLCDTTVCTHSSRQHLLHGYKIVQVYSNVSYNITKENSNFIIEGVFEKLFSETSSMVHMKAVIGI